MSLGPDYFADLYAANGDPWGFQDRWYERRKRDLTLALLPDAEYGSVVELGCSIGVLTALLAPRCGSLLATDVSAAAVAQARERCADLPQVTVAQVDGWPGGGFDLALVSEVLYYFAEDAAAALAVQVATASTVVGVHWRHEVEDYPLSGDKAHEVLGSACLGAGHRRLVEYADDDVLAAVWSRDPCSVAVRAGLA